jgi:hypothetical protein
MKKIFAAVGVIAFLLVLLIRPFEFVEVYAVHAGHVVHSLNTDDHEGHVSHAESVQTQPTNPQTVLVEMSTASLDAGDFNTGYWLVSLVLLGAVTCGCSIQRKKAKKRKLNM